MSSESEQSENPSLRPFPKLTDEERAKMFGEVQRMLNSGVIGNDRQVERRPSAEQLLVTEMASWSEEGLADYMQSVPITCELPEAKYAEMARKGGPAVPDAYLRAISAGLGHSHAAAYARCIETGQGVEFFSDSLCCEAEQYGDEQAV